MDVAASVLLEGAWYSLEQCGLLLKSAVALYREKDYSTAVSVAMLAHEELGKHRILRDEWKKAVQPGQLPSVERVREICRDHIEKQKQGQGSVMLNAASTSGLGVAIRTMVEKAQTPTDPEFQKADKLIRTAVEAKEKHAPAERHEKRLEGMFVDLEDSGTAWKRPSKAISQEDANRLLTNAANNYSGPLHHFMDPTLLQDSELADALNAWTDKPALPLPTWPT
jgi:AbiV family abortive infection protein